MRRGVALLTLVLSSAAVPVLAIGTAQTAAALLRVPRARVAASPATGSPTTQFVVRFRAPQKTGRVGGIVRRYELSVSGLSGTAGCAASASRVLPFTRAHQRIRATLDPARFGGAWCLGTFKGEVEETETPICARGVACPLFVALLGTVGRFTFRVIGDRSAPEFAGIQSAFACTPGAQRPGQTTPFTLTWDAATDPTTPSDEIVYDIYESGTAGREDFAAPTWTTDPGATTFRTPGLPSHGTFYFVVRARDRAGNEDHNRVELHGSDPCL